MEPFEFDFQLRTRMVFGCDAIDRLGALAGEMGTRRALVVTDPGIVAAGHVDRGVRSLTAANIETLVFDGARENPTTEDVAAGLAVAGRFEPELLVGLGGGSSMDCAKGINFVYTNGGEMKDYWGVGKALKEMLPMIAIPTTAGTGSEMQSFALISDADTHVKMACGDRKASCRIAILDPNLTLTQPDETTALTAVDAMCHALETAVTKKRNPVSVFFSAQSWQLIVSNMKKVFENRADVIARGNLQLGAAYAGVAIENSMLGAAHALANPLTAEFGIAHGQAVGAMMPHVIRFNGSMMESSYRDLLAGAANLETCPPVESGSAGLADWVTQLVGLTGLHTRLGDCGVDPARIPQLAEAAAKQWTGTFNPVEVNAENLAAIYEGAM